MAVSGLGAATLVLLSGYGPWVRITGFLDPAVGPVSISLSVSEFEEDGRGVDFASCSDPDSALFVAACSVGWARPALAFGKVVASAGSAEQDRGFSQAHSPFVLLHEGDYILGDWGIRDRGTGLATKGLLCLLLNRKGQPEEAWCFDGVQAPQRLKIPFNEFPREFEPTKICGIGEGLSERDGGIAILGTEAQSRHLGAYALLTWAGDEWLETQPIEEGQSAELVGGSVRVDLRLGYSGTEPQVVGVLARNRGSGGAVFVWNWKSGFVRRLHSGDPDWPTGVAPRFIVPFVQPEIRNRIPGQFVLFGGSENNDPSYDSRYITEKSWELNYAVLSMGTQVQIEGRKLLQLEVPEIDSDGRVGMDSLVLWKASDAAATEKGFLIRRGFMENKCYFLSVDSQGHRVTSTSGAWKTLQLDGKSLVVLGDMENGVIVSHNDFDCRGMRSPGPEAVTLEWVGDSGGFVEQGLADLVGSWGNSLK